MQGNARSTAAEYSGELGVTPASDSRRSTDSHLGRTFARAYPSDGECPGALGVELEALVWPATSGGALSGNGARRSGCCGAVRAEEEGEGGRGGDRMEGVAWEPAPASRPGGVGGRPRRVQRRRTAATWPAPGGARRVRAREGEGEGRQAGSLAGPKGKRGWPSSACPFLFFFLKIYFLQILSKFIWTN